MDKMPFFSTDLFCFLADNEKKLFADNSQFVKYKKSELIINKGTLNNQIFLLVNGYVKVSATVGENKRIIDVLKKDRILSIITIFSENTYKLSASAISDCELLIFNKNLLVNVMSNNYKFTSHLFKIISESAIKYINFLAFQNKRNVRGRVAEAILYLSYQVYNSNSFPLNFTRKEMAELSNTTTETIIRIFSEFKKDKIIEANGKVITIIDLEFLNKLAYSG